METTANTRQLALILIDDTLHAWKLADPAQYQPLPVLGQPQFKINDTQGLIGAWQDINERLRGEDDSDIALVHWLVDAGGRQSWLAGAADLAPSQPTPQCHQPPWQLIDWAWLCRRHGLPAAPSSQQLKTQLLPWLLTTSQAVEQQQRQQALLDEHASESARLADERRSLQQENEALRAQNAALQQIDAEHLLSFLPALYPRVFTLIGAADLALLCGRLEPLPIPNPYPEPSEETLRTLQRNFFALPQALQRQIVRFVAQLPQRQKLQPRPEMRALVQQLEEH